MHYNYTEITSVMGDPLWWDEHAIPRYKPFHPDHCANIYACEVVFLEIACQSCEHRFNVAMSRSYYQDQWEFPPHYGDPPNIDCCAAGPTMNVELIRVIEHWKQDKHEWVQVDQNTPG